MRALAEFAMRGRVQAIGVAIVALVLPFFVWVSVAVVGLVALRRSGRDAFVVLGWVLLAAFGLLLWQGDPGPLAALIATAVAALLLRWMRSWPLALVTIVIICLMGGLLVQALAGDAIAQLAVKLNKFIGENLPAEQVALLGELSVAQICGLLALRSAMLAVIALLVARWWQAALYNPGGFREEFHRMRLPLPFAVALMVAGLLIALLGEQYSWWSTLFALPFVVSGFALVHGVVSLKGWGRGPLIVLYLGWIVLLEVVMPTLLLLALVDSWWDFRGRLRARTQ